MEGHRELLPLGSIVLINGSVKKLMILARGAVVNLKREYTYFDYGACTYPEGVIGDSMLYFNASDIQKTVFTGYADADEAQMQENLKKNTAILLKSMNRKAEES